MNNASIRKFTNIRVQKANSKNNHDCSILEHWEIFDYTHRVSVRLYTNEYTV